MKRVLSTIHIFQRSIFFPGLLIAFFVSCILTSCEKVIDLDLKTSSSQIVIQGNVYDSPGPYTVSVFKSVDFDVPNVYPAVSGARVTISDDAGNSETLTEKTPGYYFTSSLQGVPGRTYTLTVQAEDKVYTSSSTMPKGVTIDSLYSKSSPFPGLKQFGFNFSDPAQEKNFYRLLDFIGHKPRESFTVGSDFGVDGKVVENVLVYRKEKLKTGDTLTLVLESIDEKVYEYFKTANYSKRESSSPANPISNISNGALGYFSASAVRKRSIVAPGENLLHGPGTFCIFATLLSYLRTYRKITTKVPVL
jgi:hypothetical protein